MSEPTPQEIAEAQQLAKVQEAQQLAKVQEAEKLRAADNFRKRQLATIDKYFAPSLNRHQRRIAAKARKKALMAKIKQTVVLLGVLLAASTAQAEPYQIGEAITIGVSATVVSMCSIDAASAYCNDTQIDMDDVPVVETQEPCVDDPEQTCTYYTKMVNY